MFTKSLTCASVKEKQALMKTLPQITENHLAQMYADVYPVLVKNLCNKFKIQIDDAEDFVQEAFIRLLRAFRKNAFKNQSFQAYMATISKNLVLDAERKLKKHKNVSIDDMLLNYIPDTSLNTEQQIIAEELKEALRRAIGRLPTDQQIVIKEYYYHQQKFQKIADVLGKSINTILGMARYAKKNIRNTLTGKTTKRKVSRRSRTA